MSCVAVECKQTTCWTFCLDMLWFWLVDLAKYLKLELLSRLESFRDWASQEFSLTSTGLLQIYKESNFHLLFQLWSEYRILYSWILPNFELSWVSSAYPTECYPTSHHWTCFKQLSSVFHCCECILSIHLFCGCGSFSKVFDSLCSGKLALASQQLYIDLSNFYFQSMNGLIGVVSKGAQIRSIRVAKTSNSVSYCFYIVNIITSGMRVYTNLLLSSWEPLVIFNLLVGMVANLAVCGTICLYRSEVNTAKKTN